MVYNQFVRFTQKHNNDAMTSKRPYRKAKTKEQAIAELKRCSGSEFDPKIVRAFLKVIEGDRHGVK